MTDTSQSITPLLQAQEEARQFVYPTTPPFSEVVGETWYLVNGLPVYYEQTVQRAGWVVKEVYAAWRDYDGDWHTPEDGVNTTIYKSGKVTQPVRCRACHGTEFIPEHYVTIQPGCRMAKNAPAPTFSSDLYYICVRCGIMHQFYVDKDGNTWTSNPEE